MAGALVAGPALARDAGPSQLDEVIVTATRREESLQKVPIAITAMSSAKLADSNITDLKSLSSMAPSVQVQPQFTPGNLVYQIRGQVQTDTGPVIDPSVGIYFDDVYIARSSGALTNFVDLERVEILKGPQGTLFGKNTTGGAIRLISKRPTHQFEGYVDGVYERFDKAKLEAVLNVPLTDTVAFRGVGQYVDKSGGYGRNALNGKPVDTEKSYFTRASLLFTPTDKLEVLVQGDYNDSTYGGLPNYIRFFSAGAGPSSALEAGLEAGFPVATAAAAGTAIMLAAVTDAKGGLNTATDVSTATASSFAFVPGTGFVFRGTGVTPMAGGTAKIWGLASNIRYDLGSANLRSITAYRRVVYTDRFDLDGSRVHISDSSALTKAMQFSQEVILNGTGMSDKFDWTVGGLYFRETPRVFGVQAALAAVQASFTGLAQTRPNSLAEKKSWGVYAQGTYKITDALSATGGLRYSHDSVALHGQTFNVLTSGAVVCGFTAANGLALSPLYKPPCDIYEAATFKKVNYTASLSYAFSEAGLVYVKTSRSYRAGGFPFRLTAPETLVPFKPEVVTDYEAGVKADWLDHRLRTNVAVFTSKAVDAQQTINGASAITGAQYTLASNFGKRRVKGIEVQTLVRASDWLTLDGSFSYLDAQLDNPNFPDEQFVLQTPKWSGAVGASVTTPPFAGFTSRLRADLTYRGRMHDGPGVRVNRVIVYQGMYRPVTLISARYTLHNDARGYEISIYGRNLTNQYYEARATSIGSLGIDLANTAEPRVYGIELKVPFGASAAKQ